MGTRNIVGYASWTAYLLRGDESQISDMDKVNCQGWLAYHGVQPGELLSVVSLPEPGTPEGAPRWPSHAVCRFTFSED